MARNPFAAVAIPGPVQAEFAARKDASKLLKWTAQRVPWIHMMSMADTCSDNYSPLGNTSGNFALFGGAPNTSMYNPSTLLPWPTLTSMDISALGSLGTTRKAIVKFKCYTDEDLVELQKCYFIPGMDVRVQWGWNESCSGEQPRLYTTKNVPRAEAICQIRDRANPAQDGFQGIVGNFKYNLMVDNSWDCEIEIISPAEPFSQSNVATQECSCPRKELNEEADTGILDAIGDFFMGEDDEVTHNHGELMSFFIDSFRNPDAMYSWLSEISAKAPATLRPYIFGQSRNYLGKARTEAGGDDSSWYEGTFFNDYDTTEQYVSWGAVEAAINVLTLPEDNTYVYGRIDSSDIEFDHTSDYNLAMCADPRVGYMGGGSQYHAGQQQGGTFQAAWQGSGKLVLCNMMFNVLYLKLELKKVLEGDKSMVTFVRNVLGELNRQCGSLWDIQIVSDSETSATCGKQGGNGGLITVIDLSTRVDEADQTPPFEIPSLNTTSTIRSMNLDLKMTGAMKTQALYSNGSQQGGGNQSQGGDPNGCEGTAFKPFSLGKNIKNLAMPSAESKKPKDCKCDDIDGTDKGETPTIGSLQGQCSKEVNDETVTALLNFITGELGKKGKTEEKTPDHCAGVSLPFDLGFECDGVGGFRFGQFLSADRLPPAIKEGWHFQVMKVEHSVTANDWTTKVNTIARNKKR